MDSSFAKPWNGITVALEVRCEDVFSCGCADKGSFRGQLRRSSVSRGHRSIVSQGQRTPNLPNIRQMTAQSDDRISMDWARHCGLQDFGRGETVRVWTILLARQTTAKGWGLTSAMSSSNVALQSANAGWIFVLTAMILCGNSATKTKWARNAAAFSGVGSASSLQCVSRTSQGPEQNNGKITGRRERTCAPGLGLPEAFSSKEASLLGRKGECPERQIGRTVNPLAKPS